MMNSRVLGGMWLFVGVSLSVQVLYGEPIRPLPEKTRLTLPAGLSVRPSKGVLPAPPQQRPASAAKNAGIMVPGKPTLEPYARSMRDVRVDSSPAEAGHAFGRLFEKGHGSDKPDASGEKALCCGVAPGDRVTYVAGWPTGTVICCDASDPNLPLLISWDDITDAGGHELCQWCDLPYTCDFPEGSAAWASCSEILGGDGNCAADVQVSAPGSWSGSTCGQDDDCSGRGSEEMVFAVAIPTAGLWTISLCGSSYDTYLRVGTTPGAADLCTDDDFCGVASSCAVQLDAGTVYVSVEGYDNFECGPFVLEVLSAIPCCGMSPGDRVCSLRTGLKGTVVCCDSDDPNLSLLVTWDGLTDAGGHGFCQWCDQPYTCDFPEGSASWVNCIEVTTEECPTCVIDYHVAGPGSWAGNTCAAGNDCVADPSPEQVFELTIPYAADWTFSLCGASFDTVLLLGSAAGQWNIGYDDDGCGTQSEMTVRLEPGVYYASVEGYEAADCGAFVLNVTAVPCTPKEPVNPGPADEAVDVALSANLQWGDAATPPAPPRIIYGVDDRLEEYQVADEALRTVGDATVVVVSEGDLHNNGDGTYSLTATTFAQWYSSTGDTPLCPDEPFANQPSPGFCSGFLVAPDIVATAGHCISSSSECGGTAFVFGFVMTDATTPVLAVPASEVYFCTQIIAREQSDADWGLIRLDRKVTGHTPLTLRQSGQIASGDPVTVIGHPVGLPRKYTGGATVRDNSQPGYFQANLDAYGGNSGSAVVNALTLEVEGILVRGNADFTTDGACDRSAVCPDTGCPSWEDVTRATAFASRLPAPTQYDVYFGACPSPAYLGTTTEAAWNPGELAPGQEYCWQVIARNGCGEVPGPVWRFTTAPDPHALSGQVFADGGDPGGGGVEGVQIEVDMGGEVVCSTLTASDGRWQCQGVPAGTATVCASLPGSCFRQVLAGTPTGRDCWDMTVSGEDPEGTSGIDFLAIAPAWADFDGDCRVAFDDLAVFQACLTGSRVPYDPQHAPDGCTLAPDGEGYWPADQDRDGDIDQSDFGAFQRCYSGEAEAPPIGCGE